MRLRRISLQNFRNISFAELSFAGRQQFLVGENGQGKTNLLEAIGYITALRTFRTNENKVLIAHGQSDAALAFDLEHERFGETRLLLKLRSGGKEVTCDGEKIVRVADYLGRFPTVVFSSQDQQLVRGAPGLRRRWLDLTLAAMDSVYLRVVQNYHRALVDRNSLLKRGARNDELAAFERPLAAAAATLVEKRREGVKVLSSFVTQAYRQISGARETAGLSYAADEDEISEAGWVSRFDKNRPRDLLLKATSTGPHRDDCAFLIGDRRADDFGSEGQQRSFVLALRLAQVEFFRERSGVQPVLLADDVLGELDPSRRRQFWDTLGQERQVIATGTRVPDTDLAAWQVFDVTGGRFLQRAAPV